jgi:hypothetical protein
MLSSCDIAATPRADGHGGMHVSIRSSSPHAALVLTSPSLAGAHSASSPPPAAAVQRAPARLGVREPVNPEERNRRLGTTADDRERDDAPGALRAGNKQDVGRSAGNEQDVGRSAMGNQREKERKAARRTQPTAPPPPSCKPGEPRARRKPRGNRGLFCKHSGCCFKYLDRD